MHATTKMNAQNNRVVITAGWYTGQEEMDYRDVTVVLILQYCGDSVSMSLSLTYSMMVSNKRSSWKQSVVFFYLQP